MLSWIFAGSRAVPSGTGLGEAALGEAALGEAAVRGGAR
jgi:hypothetical protein